MIDSQLFKFLEELTKNNNRDWFNQNKGIYQEQKARFEEFFNILALKVAEFDPNIATDLENSKFIFRIYRDTRFSPDKTPYKTHFGAMLVPGGKKSKSFSPGYYIHVEPNNSGFGAGIHQPDNKLLQQIRTYILENSKSYTKLIEELENKNLTMLKGDALKSAPRGFDKNHPDIDLIKLKDYFAYKSLSNQDLLNSDSVEKIATDLKQAKRLNDFLYKAIK